MATTSNRYEIAARARKVEKLVAAARVLRLTAAQLAGVDGPQTGVERRALLVDLAGVCDPSAETWRAVVRHLQRDEVTLARYAAAVADGQPMPRPARPGSYAEWSARGVVGDRHGAVA